MKTNYEVPQIEVVEIELEGVLCASGISQIDINGFEDAESAW